MTPQDWADAALGGQFELPETAQVPAGIRELYAGALACMAYGGFWHPFSGVAVDLLMRVMDAVVKEAAVRAGINATSFDSRLKRLKRDGIISEAQFQRLDQIRVYRNARIHAEQQEYLGIAALDWFSACRGIICDLLISCEPNNAPR